MGLIIALIIIGLIAIFSILQYNGLVRLRNGTENAWSQIDVQLRRRYDLIPNLVNTVKGYAEHERKPLKQSPKLEQLQWPDKRLGASSK